MRKVRHFIGAWLRRRFQPGKFYRIPFGPARGQFVQFHPQDNLDILFGFHEPNSFEVFRQLVKPGMVVADIGANHGYLSVFLDRLVAPDGLVYAFEPVPATFALLEQTLIQNKAHRVKPIRAAVSNQDEPLTLYLSQSHYMASLDAKWANTSDEAIETRGIRLDSFFEAEARKPDFIKMDIEGGGVFALDGMRKLIAECQPFLLLESHTPEEDRAIGQALQQGDYAVFRVGSSKPVRDLASDYRNPYGVWGTVLGVPRSKQAELNDFKPQRFQRWRLGQRDN